MGITLELRVPHIAERGYFHEILKSEALDSTRLPYLLSWNLESILESLSFIFQNY